MIGVLAPIRQQLAEWSGGLDRGVSHGDVVRVAGAEQQHSRPTVIVHEAVDLGRPAASGAAYALDEAPPL